MRDDVIAAARAVEAAQTSVRHALRTVKALDDSHERAETIGHLDEAGACLASAYLALPLAIYRYRESAPDTKW